MPFFSPTPGAVTVEQTESGRQRLYLLYFQKHLKIIAFKKKSLDGRGAARKSSHPPTRNVAQCKNIKTMIQQQLKTQFPDRGLTFAISQGTIEPNDDLKRVLPPQANFFSVILFASEYSSPDRTNTTVQSDA
jgi:hypothetical protein